MTLMFWSAYKTTVSLGGDNSEFVLFTVRTESWKWIEAIGYQGIQEVVRNITEI